MLASAAAIFLAQSSIAAKEIRNQTDIFENTNVCPSYEQFLKLEGFKNDESCDQLTSIVIENYNSGYSKPLRVISNAFDPTSAISFLAKGMRAIVRRSPVDAYNWLDLADRELFRSFLSSRDFERAGSYAALLNMVKIMAIQTMCGPTNTKCDELEPFTTLEDTLGSEFDVLANIEADILLMCLVKTDNHRVPIRDVVSSRAYQKCLDIFRR